MQATSLASHYQISRFCLHSNKDSTGLIGISRRESYKHRLGRKVGSCESGSNWNSINFYFKFCVKEHFNYLEKQEEEQRTMNPYVVVPVEFCQLDTNLEIHKVHSTPHTTKISVVGIPFTAEDPENYRLGHDWLTSFQFSVVHGQSWLVTFPWLLEDTAFDCILLQRIWGAGGSWCYPAAAFFLSEEYALVILCNLLRRWSMLDRLNL